MKIQTMERELAEHKEYIEELMAIHEQAENQRIAQLESDVEWYKKELDLNPLNWGKKKKRGKK
tara:strand:- start:953 stop:1141 length:189 start_codon:yes stop_codon:yes gene_type:complete